MRCLKTTPTLWILALVVLAGLWATPGRAQITCRAEVDRTTAVVGGTVVLTVQAEGAVTGSVDFRLPEDIQALVQGTSYSRSQTISGNRSSVTIAKTFFLTPPRAGDLVIGPVTVRDDNNVCRTEPVTVKITTGPNIPSTGTGNDASGSQDQGQQTAGGRPGDDIFITLETDLQEAWVGQQIVLTFRYYHRINPWNNPQFKAPRTAGFWREELGPQRDSRTTVRGRAYDVTEIRYALFPTHAGKLIIEPAELTFPDSGLDRFFSTRRRRGPRTLRTEPITIDVKDLPADRPADFSGLVASRLQLAAQTNRDSVPRGEPIDYQIRLVSDAFLKTFDGLTVPEVPDVRLHDAGDDFRTTIEQRRLMGQLTVEKVLVPEVEGRVPLPEVSLVWFDTRSEKFRTARATVPEVMVLPSDNPYPEQEDSGFLRSQVSRLGQDLVFIHNVPDRLRARSAVMVHRPVWWVALLAPLALLAGWRVLLQRRQSDPVVLRRRRALAEALRRLRRAAQEKRIDDVARAISGYVADRTDRPPAAVDAVAVQAYCDRLGRTEAGQRLARTLEVCDQARYGGQAAGDDPASLGQEVEQILQDLERSGETGRRGPTGLGLGAVLLLSACLAAGTATAAADPARLMAEGNQAYVEGQVEMARDLYVQAVELGADDPHLYFNLGNAHARLGELGRAVACYLRAQRLAPRDQDIQDNLAWVRGNIQDLELNESEMPLFIAQLVALVHAFTLGQWAVLLVVLVWILTVLAAWQMPRGAPHDGMRRAFLLLGAAILVVASVVLWRYRGEEVHDTAVVVVSEEAVRSGPDASFPVQFEVHDGLTIRVQEERRGWVRINLGGESLGWMPETSVERVRP